MIGIDPRKYGFLENTCPEEGVVEVIEKGDLCRSRQETNTYLRASQSVESEIITTKELATTLNTSTKVVLENAKKCLPNKIIENGKPTYWNKAEVTVLLDCIKNNPKTNSNDLYLKSKGISTDLTPALKIKQAMEMMQEAYEEELAIIKARALEAEKVVKQITDGKGCYTIKQTAKALKLPYGQIKLFQELRARGILNNDNTPRQRHVDNGHFIVVVKHINEEIGNKPVTLTTGKGLVYLSKLLGAEIDNSVLPDYE